MIDEKLAMLNPATCRFDFGRGGVPALTPQDLAAAIGMTPSGLGRDLMIASGWPDATDENAIIRRVCELAAQEVQRQHEAVTRAAMRYALDNWHSKRAVQPGLPRKWPIPAIERMPAIAKACMMEVVHRSLCPDCEGHGERMSGSLLVPCATCRTTGVVPVSDRARAVMIGMDESTYRRGGWPDVYVWALSTMIDARQSARRALRNALRD